MNLQRAHRHLLGLPHMWHPRRGTSSHPLHAGLAMCCGRELGQGGQVHDTNLVVSLAGPCRRVPFIHRHSDSRGVLGEPSRQIDDQFRTSLE